VIPDEAQRGPSPGLFSPLRLREVLFRNRVAMSPMMQYSATDGVAAPWHMAHLGSRAVGGAALVVTEQTAVSAIGRSTLRDLGLWSDEHIEPLRPIVRFLVSQGAVPAIQLGHSGRKGNVRAPWEPRSELGAEEGGWLPVAPSAISCGEGRPVPRALGLAEIGAVIDEFASAARRAAVAGFQLLEIHGAHGYLPHQFLSPLSNRRTDAYGGDFNGRARFVLELAEAVRSQWPDALPLAMRMSVTDDLPGGWTLEDTVRLIPMLHARGIDLFDISIGGIGSSHAYPTEPGALAPLAATIRARTGVAVGVSWGIGTAELADAIIAREQADIVFLGRALLRDPYWVLRAADALGVPSLWPVQIRR
jgi:2,4-dienoyl-CoA reductase-like NADH-dependent reductase (Old Yellow Enzyme family)